MFEFFRYDRRLHGDQPAPPADLPARRPVARKSFLFWGEHCVECAAPDCYTTCSLYEPRADGRCRRFAYGMYENTSHGQPAAELVFKQWAQLGTRGNLKLEPVENLARREAWIRRLVPVVDRVGGLLWHVTRDGRFRESAHRLLERYCRSLHRGTASEERPDCFLFEVHNPGTEMVRLQLRMSAVSPRPALGPDHVQIKPAFQASFDAAPGYSRHEIAYELFRGIAEREPFDMTLTPEGDSAARIVVLTADFVKFEPAPAPTGRPAAAIKCVVWDLDNTMWNGVLLERETVELRPGILDTIRDLDTRGILHSVASKNSFEHAWPTVERLGIGEYVLYPQITWSPKSQSLRAIAQQLNIGLDTFAFVDDSEFELDEVRQALPAVTCIHVNDLTEALRDPRFAGSSTPDARNRRHLYKQAIARDAALQESGADYLKFLADSQIVLELAEYSDQFSERVAELVQRTNQLNFSGRKYKASEVAGLLSDSSSRKFVLRCSDRYGSYGTVGFVIASAREQVVEIQDFMLSCRVQGKFIEQALFRHLIERHYPDARRLWLNYRRTDRNAPALSVLTTLGFAEAPSGGMALDLQPDSLECAFIDTRCAECEAGRCVTPGAERGAVAPAESEARV